MKLTETRKKQVIADYLSTGSYRATARMHGISANTVKSLCAKDVQFVQKCTEKKEQMEADIFRHMEGQRDKVCLILDKYLDALLDDDKIKAATTSQLTTALGTLIDKYTMNKAKSGEDESATGVVMMPEVKEDP